MSRIVAVLVLSCALGAHAAAQKPAAPRKPSAQKVDGRVTPLAPKDHSKHRITRSKNPAGKFAVVTWGENRIALKRPVANCDVALDAKGEHLFILAGGVRSALDFYIVAKKDGAAHYFATSNGRRLPRKFNDGKQSWPTLEPPHFVLFGYEQGAGIEFRAFDFRGRLLSQRTLPSSVTGWKVDSMPDEGYLYVAFGSGVELLRIRHPLAPLVELSGGGLVQFGKVRIGRRSRQVVELRNRGKRPARVKVGPLERGFHFVRKPPVVIPAGEARSVVVEYRPTKAGPVEWRMQISASGVVPAHIVVLVATGVPVASAPAAKPPPPVVAKPVAAPLAPRVRHFRCYPLSSARALILGQIQTPAPASVVLRAGKMRKSVTVAADGRFHAELDVAPGTSLQVGAAVGMSESPFVLLGTVPNALRIAGQAIVILGSPGARFELNVLSSGESLRRWRGRLDAAGRRRLPLSLLGSAKERAASPHAIELQLTLPGAVAPSGRIVVPGTKREGSGK